MTRFLKKLLDGIPPGFYKIDSERLVPTTCIICSNTIHATPAWIYTDSDKWLEVHVELCDECLDKADEDDADDDAESD